MPGRCIFQSNSDAGHIVGKSRDGTEVCNDGVYEYSKAESSQAQSTKQLNALQSSCETSPAGRVFGRTRGWVDGEMLGLCLVSLTWVELSEILLRRPEIA